MNNRRYPSGWWIFPCLSVSVLLVITAVFGAAGLFCSLFVLAILLAVLL